MALATARWTCTPYSTGDVEGLVAELGVSLPTATVLARRGYADPDGARRFLAADERHSPHAFGGMEQARDLVLGHVSAGSSIVVHGDYDVDGVCSTAMVVRTLRRLGAAPAWHIPSRDEGYGLSIATVERLAAEGVRLIVTVDCAIAAVDEVARARELGVDVLVTDHHRPGERLPDCPVIHPVVSGYPFPDLCAAGVAQKLVEALLVGAGLDPAEAAEYADLVGLATVADVVPLRGENRRLAREGLRAMARTRRPGLRALMEVASVDPGAVDERALGFRLAPRINAAGRLARADASLELLLTDDEARAAQIADELDLMNRERQDVETRILFGAEAARAEHAEAPAYVLAGEGWHPGVIGIVASRMVERHHRPCVMVALDGATGRGSGRSISAFDLHAALAACSGHLLRFGGHRAAAGLEIEASEVEAFRAAFTGHASSVLTPADLVPVERVDAVVGPDRLGTPLAEELGRLAPFGHGNPAPTLLVPAARVGEVRSMGEDGQHSRFTIAGGGARARAVAFRVAPGSLPESLEERYDAAVRLELNEWNGAVEPRLVVRALCPTEPGRFSLPAARWSFLETLERALDSDPATPVVGAPVRAVRDRRGEGFAGVAGDLLSSGERVAIVCADVGRRRPVLEEVIGGIASAVAPADPDDERRPALISWDELALDPELASEFDHLVALDPPVSPRGETLLAAAPVAPGGAGSAHLAWGRPEAEFALAVARRDLDLRPTAVAIYRSLRASGPGDGSRLGNLLREAASHPVPPAVCARAVRVLVELELVRLERGERGLVLEAIKRPRTDLEGSPTYRAARQRLAEAARYLEDTAARAA